MSTDTIYLDHAAATPVDERVIKVMLPYFNKSFFNPSSPYMPALNVRREYEAAKDTLARCIGAKADELVMTAGATESINLAFNGIGGHVVTAKSEHHAVLAAASGHEHTFIEVDERAIVSSEAIVQAIQPDTRLVSVALANNELGTIQSLRDIATVIERERSVRLEAGNHTPLYLHSDASQGAGQLDIHVARLGVDLLTLNAGKVYGPKQVGLLWVARSARLSPQILGGGQERGLRSGTENVAGVIGFATALSLAEKHRKSEANRLKQLRDGLQRRLLQAFPDAVVSGYQKHRLSSHLHISFPRIDAERVVFGLEARGVLVATGSACAANKGTRSHVLEAIGLDPALADGSLRLTLGQLSNEDNIAKAGDIIVDILQAEYARIKG